MARVIVSDGEVEIRYVVPTKPGQDNARFSHLHPDYRTVLPLGEADPENLLFLGRSENAVRIQVAVALTAFLLLHIAHKAQAAVASILAFARLES